MATKEHSPQALHDGVSMVELTPLEKSLVNDYQRGFPLSARPYADLATELGTDEATVVTTLASLMERGVVTRVGAVLRPNSVGASTLAALAVPPARLEEVANMVSSYQEVNHNYERSHPFNLWFVVTASDSERLDEVLDDIEERSGLRVLDLPLEAEYHIDLGFDLRWN